MEVLYKTVILSSSHLYILLAVFSLDSKEQERHVPANGSQRRQLVPFGSWENSKLSMVVLVLSHTHAVYVKALLAYLQGQLYVKVVYGVTV